MTSFEERVWNQCKRIPKGRVSTYKELAKAIGKPKAFRAVGNALNKNPFPVKVPCHRVVKSNGFIGGFAKGKKKKIELLKKEGIQVKKNKVKDFKEKLFQFHSKSVSFSFSLD
jgi:methylated-DNA-[protein]-cysteine S-methyltransferase